VKVGDLVKHVSWDGVGIVTYLWSKVPGYSASVSVLFKDGEYDVDGADLEVTSEGR
jgi:hypothetical protein